MTVRTERFLIVNADDFGHSEAINRGIIVAHEQGIVTSASMMVRWPFARAAAAYARTHPSFSLGLHLDLGEWVYRGGEWVAEYMVVAMEHIDHVVHEGAVVREMYRQLEQFRDLVGCNPTHLDSHQHVHCRDPVYTIAATIAHDLDIPLRHYSPHIHYCGDFYGQTGQGVPLPDAISVERLQDILARLPLGITELGCHPGMGNGIASVYNIEREQELQVLCHPDIRASIDQEKVGLCSFSGITRYS